MDNNSRIFVTALRDACNRALEDGRIGEQDGHIETIEVTEPGQRAELRLNEAGQVEQIGKTIPMELCVTCFGSYSPTEARRVYTYQGAIQVMAMVAQFIAGRAIYDLDMEKLRCRS
jgi:hypothetical protein